MTYVGKYEKAYIGPHSSYLVIFLTFFRKFVLIEIEWKTADPAKTKIKVLFKKKKTKKKNTRLNPKNI